MSAATSLCVERLRSGTRVVGTFVSLGSPAVTHALAVAGLDFLLMDLEH